MTKKTTPTTERRNAHTPAPTKRASFLPDAGPPPPAPEDALPDTPAARTCVQCHGLIPPHVTEGVFCSRGHFVAYREETQRLESRARDLETELSRVRGALSRRIRT